MEKDNLEIDLTNLEDFETESFLESENHFRGKRFSKIDCQIEKKCNSFNLCKNKLLHEDQKGMSGAAIDQNLNCVCHTGLINLIQGTQKPNVNQQENEYFNSVIEHPQQAKKKIFGDGFVGNMGEFDPDSLGYIIFTQSEKNKNVK
ncbi:hypothetical protein ACTFIZ_001624 [Dictyostelium cf. discoideum]